MADKADEARARADARFKQQEQRPPNTDFAKAEQSAIAKAVDEKTARLKAQRLAKEAASAAEEQQQRAMKPKGRGGARKPSGGHSRVGARKRRPKLIANPDEVKGG